MRERRFCCPFSRRCRGITPARAGKTACLNKFHLHDQDHPRSCGKDRYMSRRLRTWEGSPPLVRERQTDVIVKGIRMGITPARAGKTLYDGAKWVRLGDHPRSCGKDDGAGMERRYYLGSPPLVRERLRSIALRFDDEGITPARAGKTVMDPFICAISLLPVFKIYLISFQSISTLQLLRNLGGC